MNIIGNTNDGADGKEVALISVLGFRTLQMGENEYQDK